MKKRKSILHEKERSGPPDALRGFWAGNYSKTAQETPKNTTYVVGGCSVHTRKSEITIFGYFFWTFTSLNTRSILTRGSRVFFYVSIERRKHDMYVGIDFGTSNSSAAVYDGRHIRYIPLDPLNEEDVHVLSSMLYISSRVAASLLRLYAMFTLSAVSKRRGLG